MVPSKRRSIKRKPRKSPQVQPCLAEVPPGLEAVAWKELTELGGQRLQWTKTRNVEPGILCFNWSGALQTLNKSKTTHSIYTLVNHPIPRPKGLLGHEHFNTLLAQIQAVRTIFPPKTFKTLYLSAAGSHTSIMERLINELADATGLQIASHEGDLLLRVRRPPDKSRGWETLVRTSPRPLATRDWRVCNFEGALNAAVAHSMALLTQPSAADRFINLVCGSGSLLIERSLCTDYEVLIGLDNNLEAIGCARQNLEAVGNPPRTTLLQADVRRTPLPNSWANALVADLPFGHLVGTHEHNLELYPEILHEAARLAAPGAVFVLISHEVRLLENLLKNSQLWETQEILRVWLGGLNPRIFILKRYRD